MAQIPARFCPQCGTAVPAGQRFCSNCGTTMDANFGNPTAASSSDARHSQYPDIPMQGGAAPPPHRRNRLRRHLLLSRLIQTTLLNLPRTAMRRQIPPMGSQLR